MCGPDVSVLDALEEISSQIQMFESQMEEFDEFVASVTESPTVDGSNTDVFQ
jgi:prefoldin subunit 5